MPRCYLLTLASSSSLDQQSNNVSLFKAADLSPIAFFDIGGTNNRVASDGLHFWVTLNFNNTVARF